MKYKYLFTPEKIGSLEIKNRTIMAPMSAALGHPDGTMSDELIAYYEARAKGGIGMILTEYAYVTPENFNLGTSLHDTGGAIRYAPFLYEQLRSVLALNLDRVTLENFFYGNAFRLYSKTAERIYGK